jgi:hypothetical protein
MEAPSIGCKIIALHHRGGKMNYPLYEINGVKTYRTPRHLLTLRDVTCRACAKPVSAKILICDNCGYEFQTKENSK